MDVGDSHVVLTAVPLRRQARSLWLAKAPPLTITFVETPAATTDGAARSAFGGTLTIGILCKEPHMSAERTPSIMTHTLSDVVLQILSEHLQ